MIDIRKTSVARHLTVIRILSALPLLLIGAQHLIGWAPIQPILEGARIPAVAFWTIVVPVLEVLAGLALALGFYARFGALIALATMIVAVYAHQVHDWADEPTVLLPVAVALGVVQILWSGAGAFSYDLASTPRS